MNEKNLYVKPVIIEEEDLNRNLIYAEERTKDDFEPPCSTII